MVVSPRLGVGIIVALVCAFPARAGFPGWVGPTFRYWEGKVFVDGEEVLFARHTIKVGQIVATKRGRAELTLFPDAFLRLAENTSIKLLCDEFADTAVELQSGSLFLDAIAWHRRARLIVRYQNTAVTLEKAGEYRVDATAGILRVYGGQASLRREASVAEVHAGQQISLRDDSTASNFDKKDKQEDTFGRWESRRFMWDFVRNYQVQGTACIGKSTEPLDRQTVYPSGDYCSPSGKVAVEADPEP